MSTPRRDLWNACPWASKRFTVVLIIFIVSCCNGWSVWAIGIQQKSQTIPGVILSYSRKRSSLRKACQVCYWASKRFIQTYRNGCFVRFKGHSVAKENIHSQEVVSDVLLGAQTFYYDVLIGCFMRFEVPEKSQIILRVTNCQGKWGQPGRTCWMCYWASKRFIVMLQLGVL